MMKTMLIRVLDFVEWPNGADLAPTFLRERGTPVPPNPRG